MCDIIETYGKYVKHGNKEIFKKNRSNFMKYLIIYVVFLHNISGYKVKHFVIYHCVVFHETFCMIFTENILWKYCCALFQETFCVTFTHDISTFHVFHIFAIGFNNSTYFTILYILFHFTSLPARYVSRRRRPLVWVCTEGCPNPSPPGCRRRADWAWLGVRVTPESEQSPPSAAPGPGSSSPSCSGNIKEYWGILEMACNIDEYWHILNWKSTVLRVRNIE